MSMFSMTGKLAVVTGAASGIGLATANVFAQAGCDLVLLDLDDAHAKQAAEDIQRATGRSVQGLACDVGDAASVAAAFGQIGAAVNILVNCAGIAHIGTLETTTAADFDRLYRVNVRGTYLCMQAALGSMLIAKSGVILNMASIAATAGLADRFAYSMTKGAVLAMTLSVAKDYIHRGIRCNCISPARIHTPFVDSFVAKNYAGKEAEMMAMLAKAQPIGRMGTPPEVAALALYLCSDEASFVTGTDYPFDGGFFNLR